MSELLYGPKREKRSVRMLYLFPQHWLQPFACTGVHYATAIEPLAKVTPCERLIEHLAKVQKRFRTLNRPSRMCRVAQGWFLPLPFGSEHARQGVTVMTVEFNTFAWTL